MLLHKRRPVAVGSERNASRIWNICCWIGPDVCVTGIGLLYFLAGLKPSPINSFFRFILVPHLMAMCLILSLLQTNASRGGIWRFITESGIMTVIGYCSFPIYLLQQVLLNFYARIIYDDLRTGFFPIIKGGTDPAKYGIYGDDTWFGDKPWWWKLIGCICLLMFCWPIQRYYQDTLVATVSARILGSRLFSKLSSWLCVK